MAEEKKKKGASIGEGSGGKKHKEAQPKRTLEKHMQMQHGRQQQSKAGYSQGAAEGPKNPGLPKALARNHWWHSKKAKRVPKDGQAVTKKAKPSEEEGGATKKAATPSIGESGEPVLGKKRKLQLKKKRQRKSRLMRKKAGEKDEGEAAVGRRTTPVQSVESVKGTKAQTERAPERCGHVGQSAQDKSRPAPGAKSQDQGTASPPTQGPFPRPGLQKQGGKKKQTRKRPKKFKQVPSSGGGGTGTGEKAEGGPKATSSEAGNSSQGRGAVMEEQEAATIDGKAALVDTGPSREDSVSVNWKALLPIVEKSKQRAKKRPSKSGKDGKIPSQPKPSKPDIWFDDVDPSLIRANESVEKDLSDSESETSDNPLIRQDAKDCLTKCLAMDCEMVGTGPRGSQSALARVSVVNQYGSCVLDKYVNPREPVTDYRTFVSGIRPRDLRDKGEDFDKVQKELANLLKGRIVVGHALHNDFKVLYFSHPRSMVRDTSSYQPFKELFKSKRPGLKKLTELVLKVKVQKGEHNSVEDAQAAMRLYMLHRKQWEKSLRQKGHSQVQVQPSIKKPAKVHKK